jgi:signal peptidase I
MRRARSDSEDADAEEDEDGEERVARPHRSRGRTAGRGPVRTWTPEGVEEVGTTGGWFGGPKRPVYWRARDSLYFEPLVALAIVVLLLVGLWAYAQNWPPIYVVESRSMQHGLDDHLGLVNTGDLVLAQKLDPSTVTSYMTGLQTGYQTYGEFGDVLLFHPNGDSGVYPIIHRAIIHLDHNPDGTWSAPDLAGLSCDATSHPYYAVSPGAVGCGTSHLTGTLTLFNVGWQAATVTIPLGQLGSTSGFVTMGDNNYIPGSPSRGEPDQTSGISSLVQNGWLLGAARGMLPWFGSLKLALEGQASMVPSQSWELMGAAIATVLLSALGLHLALRRHLEDEEGEEDSVTWGERVRGLFMREPEPDEEADDEIESEGRRPREHRRRFKPISKEKILRRHRRLSSGGRPRPLVRRSNRGARHRHERADDL